MTGRTSSIFSGSTRTGDHINSLTSHNDTPNKALLGRCLDVLARNPLAAALLVDSTCCHTPAQSGVADFPRSGPRAIGWEVRGKDEDFPATALLRADVIHAKQDSLVTQQQQLLDGRCRHLPTGYRRGMAQPRDSRCRTGLGHVPDGSRRVEPSGTRITDAAHCSWLRSSTRAVR
jgi:hypothetical protein